MGWGMHLKMEEKHVSRVPRGRFQGRVNEGGVWDGRMIQQQNAQFFGEFFE